MRNGERGVIPQSEFRIPQGGLLSVALSRPLALGTGITKRYRGWELPTTAPYEARTFLSPRMASDRPTDRRTELAWYRPNVPLRRECEQSGRTETHLGGVTITHPSKSHDFAYKVMSAFQICGPISCKTCTPTRRDVAIFGKRHYNRRNGYSFSALPRCPKRTTLEPREIHP